MWPLPRHEPVDIEDFRSGSRRFTEFRIADATHDELMFQRTVPGFAPSPDSMRLAEQSCAPMAAALAALGITAEAAIDLWVVVQMGLTDQQPANDPGGRRFVDLLDAAIDMYVANRPNRQHTTPRRMKTDTTTDDGRRYRALALFGESTSCSRCSSMTRAWSSTAGSAATSSPCGASSDGGLPRSATPSPSPCRPITTSCWTTTTSGKDRSYSAAPMSKGIGSRWWSGRWMRAQRQIESSWTRCSRRAAVTILRRRCGCGRRWGVGTTSSTRCFATGQLVPRRCRPRTGRSSGCSDVSWRASTAIAITRSARTSLGSSPPNARPRTRT